MAHQCPTCGASVVFGGECPNCQRFLNRKTEIKIEGSDYKQVEYVLNSALRAARQSRNYAIFAVLISGIAGTIAILANLSAIATFLGFSVGSP